ncbi:guanine nucleotide binding protein, alpha subunit [Infundibulicybe gibba]|nr:guanine nucleotide binding protein, alpha subunit [Infundibulicybe gibba]
MGIFKSNPFVYITLPLPGETPNQKAVRKRRASARRVSDRIDEEIRLECAAIGEQRGSIKLLLLGQSENGKFTFLSFAIWLTAGRPDLKMKYAPTAWKKERAAWKLVIQLNLIRTIITIIETLQAETDNQPLSTSASTLQSPVSLNNARASTSSSLSPDIINSHAPPACTSAPQAPPGPTPSAEEDFKRRLGAGPGEVVLPEGMHSHLLSLWDVPEDIERHHRRYMSNTGRGGGDEERCWDDATDLIASCREDMMALWADKAVRAVLNVRGMRLEDSANFFLNDLERIAARNYEPSDGDILRASPRTSAVQEHKIRFENESPQFLDKGTNYGKLIYSISELTANEIAPKRDAWEPYFDNVNAIIFPVSCFDEYLSEKPYTNRLEETFHLWRAVCSSTLLSQATIFLILNECDVLKHKLKAGVRVHQHLVSYGDRPNEAAAVIESTFMLPPTPVSDISMPLAKLHLLIPKT